MAHAPAKIVFGGLVFAMPGEGFSNPGHIAGTFDSLERHGITTIDTSKAYGNSEQVLGTANATARFTVDTKCLGGMSPSPSTRDVVVANGKESFETLRTTSVDVYYIHVPDARIPLEETLAGVDELYRAGAFRRFGLCNSKMSIVEDAVRIAKERGFVAPSVYQGCYNAVTRRWETSLFPVLRKHNIAFYAYSPIAGGWFAKRPEDLAGGAGTGRWDPNSQPGGMYNDMYVKPPTMLKGLERWGKIAAEEGVSGLELALRWVVHNSVLRGELGDGVIIGANNDAQLDGVMAGINKGPLSAEVEQKIDGVWELIKDDAPSDDPMDIVKAVLFGSGK